MAPLAQIFLSYDGEDGFEAALLQHRLELLLADLDVVVWTFERDQARDERAVGKSLADHIKGSDAAIFLLSQFTLQDGATQWMELAYADAFGIPTFVLLHHLSFEEIQRSERGVPPLLTAGHCTPAREWRALEPALRERCLESRSDER